jgi:hypothetical protein
MPFRPISAVCLALLFHATLSHAQSSEATPGIFILENAACRVEMDREHGRLLRLLDKRGSIDLEAAPEAAENFRLYVTRGEQPRSCIYGRDQALAADGSRATPDELVLHWAGPMKDDHGRAHDLAATLRVSLEAESAVFRFTFTNRTRETVQEAWYPIIGGLLDFGPPGSRGETTLSPPPHTAKRFVRPFGQHLAVYPSQNMGYVQLENPVAKRSMYLGAHDPIARFKGFFFFDTSEGDAANVAGCLLHYPFTKPGETFEGSPLVVRFHDGDWIAGGKQIYRPWFVKTFGLMKPEEDWIRRQGFYQMIMIMLPEGNINYTCRQIPELARDGLKYGVTALQIAGWQFGGHDNGYPYYEPDPRLGTWDDLADAIRQCHEMGVKIYFFVNIHVNNLDTAWYERELKDYNFETLSGHAGTIAGWGMGTLGSRTNLTTPVMAFADASFPGLADPQLAYFKKLAEIGADGLHIDKLFPQPLNFNPRIVMSPDQAPWEGTVRLIERIGRECRAIHPDFRISFETNWDRVLSYGAATWWAGNMTTARRVFPELVETVGLYQPYDYIFLNDAVRRGLTVMIAPHHFNRSMDYPSWRGLSRYIRDVKRLRDELADYIFTAEILDPGEAAFLDQTPPAGIDRGVYRNRINGKRACVLTNSGGSTATVVLAGFGDTRTGQVRIYRPAGERRELDLPAKIPVEPERLVFVIEE